MISPPRAATSAAFSAMVGILLLVFTPGHLPASASKEVLRRYRKSAIITIPLAVYIIGTIQHEMPLHFC